MKDFIIGVIVLIALVIIFIKFKKQIKAKLQNRIEKNAVKIPSLTYESKGEQITEDIVLKKSSLPLMGDWARIYPPIDEEGNINWINTIFGGKKNFIKLLIILGLVAVILFGYYELFNQISYLKENCICNLIP
jgi:hypothetical protein